MRGLLHLIFFVGKFIKLMPIIFRVFFQETEFLSVLTGSLFLAFFPIVSVNIAAGVRFN